MENLKTRLTDLHLMEKFQSYEKRGIIIGVCIALAVVGIIAIGIIKYLWLKKQFDGLCYDLDDLYDESDFDDDECCEDGYCVLNEEEQQEAH
jgi:hypothetical protein